jgi:hypothetical protein
LREVHRNVDQSNKDHRFHRSSGVAAQTTNKTFLCFFGSIKTVESLPLQFPSPTSPQTTIQASTRHDHHPTPPFLILSILLNS